MLIPSLALLNLPEIDLPEGEKILHESKAGGKVYVLIRGSVRVENGGTTICTVNKPGAVFGEMSALLRQNHVATVVVDEPSRFYVVEDLEALVNAHPEISFELLKIMAERLQGMNAAVRRMRRKSWWKLWWG